MKIQAYFWDLDSFFPPWTRHYELYTLVTKENKLFWQVDYDSGPHGCYKANLNKNIPMLGPSIPHFPWDFKYDDIKFNKFLYAHPVISRLHSILMIITLVMTGTIVICFKQCIKCTYAIYQKSKNLFCLPK